MIDSSDKGVLQRLVGLVADFYDWLEDALDDPLVRRTMLIDLGLDPANISNGLDRPNIPTDKLDSIKAYRDSDDVDAEAFVSAVEDIVDTVHAVGAFIEALNVSGDAAIEEYVHRFYNLMGLNYVRLRFPELYFLAQPFGFIEETISSHESARFHLQRILEALFDTDTYKSLFSLETEEEARNLSFATLLPLGLGIAQLLPKTINQKMLYGWETLDGSATPEADIVSERALSISLSTTKKEDDSDGETTVSIVLNLQWVPKDHGGPFLFVSVGGAEELEAPFAGDWTLKYKFSSASAIDFFFNTKNKPIVHGPTDASASFSIERKTAGPADPIVLPGSKNTHLEFGKLSFSGELSSLGADIKFLAKDSALVLGNADGDGFIGKILPGGESRIPFDFGMGVSSDRGLYFEGGAGLAANIAINKNLGPLKIQSVTVALVPASDTDNSGSVAEISTNLGLKLGPIDFVVERIGYRMGFGIPDENGDSKVSNVKLGFQSPSSIGLSVDGGGFKGGGFLKFEPDEHRYVGILELEYKKKLNLKAIGLLTTQMPNGSDGFSLLIIITAEFNPIQLGFGFTLNGVGGLLGLNRTAKVERLRTGIKDNTLSSILFPKDIVANAGRIISDLRQVFPPEQDRFIFGPMAKIGWGTPTLITIDLGLMIEVPNPVRLLILGVVRAQIPNEEERKKKEEKEGREIPRILQLQVNFLGEIDFEAERLSFDASLYDSKLLSFTLSGDMALRFSWGSDPNFLLTVGGFHPAYAPPPLALPNLQRLTLQLLSGNNPRLTLETYFAVTSNTVQFGARLELYAVKSKFNVSGFLSFDVLFQFSPFLFIADIGAMLALRIGSSNIASISVSLTLSGPTPWHARGTAKLKICWFFTLKVRFNKTFGEEHDTRLDDVPVLPLLQAALSNTGNWEVQIPRGRHALVSVREIAVSGAEVVADPAGVIIISQKVVPLNVTIEKFGNQQPSDGHHFAIEHVRVEPVNETDLEVMELLSMAAVQEHFAPAQFFEKSDTEKLSSRSFEYYDSGVKLTESEELATDYAVRRPVEYEVFYPKEQRHQGLRRRPDLLPPDFAGFSAGTRQGAIAGSPLSFANTAKSALAPSAVRFSQEQFVVVSAIDLLPVTEEAVAASEAGAYSLMNEMIRNNPDREGELQVVPTFEVNRS